MTLPGTRAARGGSFRTGNFARVNVTADPIFWARFAKIDRFSLRSIITTVASGGSSIRAPRADARSDCGNARSTCKSGVIWNLSQSGLRSNTLTACCCFIVGCWCSVGCLLGLTGLGFLIEASKSFIIAALELVCSLQFGVHRGGLRFEQFCELG